jgi:hypothetical protein
VKSSYPLGSCPNLELIIIIPLYLPRVTHSSLVVYKGKPVCAAITKLYALRFLIESK